MKSFGWWIKQILFGGVSLLFLLLGLNALWSAYQMQNPHEFIMLFFSSSLMILISAVGMIYPAVRIFACLRARKNNPCST
ncbi:MAG TPA: hypothetical protein PLB96_01380 [Syntrophales bacterium]|nr:hypothetical protein [Syntrophales bacterium]